MSSFIGSIVWGRLADQTGAYKEIIMGTALVNQPLAVTHARPQPQPHRQPHSAHRAPPFEVASGLGGAFMWGAIQNDRARLLGAVALFSLFNRPPQGEQV